jgi:hypothetical protein
MSATLEKLAVVEQVPVRHRDAAVQKNAGLPAPVIARKRHVERWSSSLAPEDLLCLLSAIEQQVMPQLIAGYSPARCAPLGPHES